MLVKTKTKLGWEEREEGRTLHLIAPLRCVSNLGAIIQVNMRTQDDNNHNKVNRQETRRFYLVVRLMPTPRCGDLLRSRIVLNPSQEIQWSTLSITISFLCSFPVCKESPQVGASRPYNIDHKRSTRVRDGKQHTQDSIRSKHTHTIQDLSSKHSTESSQLKRSSNH